MAYNIFSQTSKKINWEELHLIVVSQRNLEYIPMPGKGIDGGDALGISIPSKNFSEITWEELNTTISLLTLEYQFEFYDMYHGAKIDSRILGEIKKVLLSP